jgi:UDP-glucuronate 4-epimerase
MPRVLITGAAGFIGMHTAIRFLREGWDVVGLDNMNDYYSVTLKIDRVKKVTHVASNCARSFEMYEADLNSNVWEKIDSFDFEAVIHLAAQAGVRYSIESPRTYLESNILGFQAVLEFVAKSGIKRFLYASSSSVYGKNSAQPFSEKAACDSPESYYAATKRANELMAKSYFHTEAVSSIGLRFFTVYGPWGRPDMAPILFAKAGKANQTIKVFNHGNQQRDFTYVDDIVEGIFLLTVMENFPNQSLVCNIGNGTPIYLMEFISTLEQTMGKTFIKKYVDAQKGDVEVTFADNSRLSELIGYAPKTNLKKGVQMFIRWFEEYYG